MVEIATGLMSPRQADGLAERTVGLSPSLLTDHPVIEHRWRWPGRQRICVLLPPAGSPA
jgi:hypothetical protein